MEKVDSEKIRLYIRDSMIPDIVQSNPMKRRMGQTGHINHIIALVESIIEKERKYD